MGQITISLQNFTVNKKHDIDKDNPYLWIVGLNLDRDAALAAVAIAAGTRQNLDGTGVIITRNALVGNLGDKFKKGESRAVPEGIRTIRETVNPIGTQPSTFTLLVTAMEHSTTSQKTQQEAYDAMVNQIEAFLIARMRALQFTAPSAAELDTLQDDVRKAVIDVFKPNPFSDNYINSEQRDFTLGATATSQPFTMHFVSKHGGTDYTLTGTMAYTL